MEINKLLNKLWYGKDEHKNTSFSSPEVLYRTAKKILPQLKKRQVQQFLSQQLAYSTFREFRKGSIDRNILVNRPGHVLAFDTAFLKKFGHKGGVKFLLVGVDIFSGYTKVAGLKSLKNATQAFSKLLKEFQDKFKTIENIVLDRGGENYSIKRYAEAENIDVFFAPELSVNKASRAERAIRILRQRMSKLLLSNPLMMPLTAAKLSADSYNSTINQETGVAPADVEGEKIGVILRHRMDKQMKQLSKASFNPKFKIGDIVKLKIVRKNTVFVKSNEPIWSFESFVIVSVKDTTPRYSYKIKKVGGSTKTASVPERYLQLVKSDG